jgi:4-diphosphocytidyl-2-C-methyl-D-erythritol kinase
LVTPRAMKTGNQDESRRLEVLAPAKINLTLEVFGKRPDGYHELRSLVVPVSIFDTLAFELADNTLEVSCTAAGLPGDNLPLLPAADDNLALRAGRLLRDVTGCRGGARIEIRKEIPIGGGMGGGSADAAATLKGLNRLWNTGLSLEQLVELGSRLGSDIPAMIHGRAVCMAGRGERTSPVPCRWPAGTEWWVVVVNPGFNVPTRDVYRRFRTGLTSPGETFTNARFALESGDRKLASSSLLNSLEATVFEKYPLLAMLAERLRSAGAAGVLLSGSGASIFAMAADHGRALEIEAQIRRETGPWLWTRVAQVLPDGVMVAHGPLEARV